MSDGVRPHVIRRGDTPLRLSAMYGVPIAEIERHPDNAPLRMAMHRHCLPVGETVFIPTPARGPAVAPRTKNVFVAEVPMHRVSIVFRDGVGPLAKQRFELHGLDADPVEGELGDDGRFERDVPIHTDRLRIVFPTLGVEHAIWVGHLGPPSDEAGWEARLREAGYGPIGDPRSDGFSFVDKEARARALAGFQSAHGLAPSGNPDETTLAALCDQGGETRW